MKKIKYFIIITRPVNFAISFLSLIVAGLICNNNQLNLNIIFAAVSAAFVGSAGNIINDYFDIEIDKINRPNRILPSNKLSLNEAQTEFVVLNIAAVILSFFINNYALIIVIFSITVIFAYSAYFKKIPLLGNIVVSFFTGLAFIYGGAAVENISAAVIPAVFAFTTNLIRELIKDIEDIKGDAANNVFTYPSKHGINKTKYLILSLTIMLMILTTIPYILEIYKIEFFLIAMSFINPLFLLMLKRLFENDELSNMKSSSRIVKVNMIIGLIAIYVGAV
ncbi:MAG: geranylgeranylglycerol-phosphate geranylgeranyltransferase [Melioribacteraceae bacterium]|nr:geranylgeranylglycerol-phosphate geranylgeranyltransferase [Melioribacteraceae bacterium]